MLLWADLGVSLVLSLNPLFTSAFVWVNIDLLKTFSVEEISGTLLAMAFAYFSINVGGWLDLLLIYIGVLSGLL